jgi:ribonuclease P protein component
VVAHLLVPADPQGSARVGMVVSKSVGNAVTRNLVKRRLRHLVKDELAGLPEGSLVVLRAQPASASASYAELGAELTRCLRGVRDRSLEPAR